MLSLKLIQSNTFLVSMKKSGNKTLAFREENRENGSVS